MKRSYQKRRRRLCVFMAVCVAIFAWLYWGNTAIQTTHIAIVSESLPEQYDGFTIVQVSDLHNASFGEGQKRLIAEVRAAAPDIIAVTGDMIDANRTDVETAMEFVYAAVEIAPVYYVTGNHEAMTGEYAELKRQMLAAGVTILENEGVEISRAGAIVRILGLDDPAMSSRAAAKAALYSMMREEGAAQYTVLLSHRPEMFSTYAASGVDLVLTGHAHGGQVRLPFIGGLYAPGQGVFPKYDAGTYVNGETTMVVSRGLGNSSFPVRVNNRPELVAVTLRCGA